MRRIILAIGVAALALGLAGGFLIRPSGVPDRLGIEGQPYFLAGVNYPYKSAEDFGNGAWGYSGVAQPTTDQEIDTDFANLHASGVRVVKWRVFNDGRYSPDFDQDGNPIGLDDHFFKDLDAALALARKHDLYLILTLFDSGFWTTDCVQRDVHLGGHEDVMADPIKRQRMIDRAIVPLVRHLGSNDRVLAYEIIAEPEWGITELNHDQDGRSKIPLADVRPFVARIAAAIHYYTPSLATVESNRSSNMEHWKGLGLDYYSFSWYDWLEPYEPLDRPAASFGLDRPVVLGEFPSHGSKYYHLAQVYDIAVRQGYAGALAWSYGNADQYSDWTNVADEYLRWNREHWALVDIGAQATSPSSPAQLLPPPYQYANVKVIEGTNSNYLQADVAAIPGTYHLQWFVYDVAANPGRPSSEQTVALTRALAQLTMPLGSLAQGRTYKVSLGIFDQKDRLVKWFDGVAVLTLQGDAPQISPKVVEDPCGKRLPTDDG